MSQTIAVLDSAHLDDGPPDEALDRLIDASWRTAEQHGIFVLPAVPSTPEDEHEGHRPLTDRLELLIKRGQRAGVFDRRLPARWLAAAFIALAHTAGEESGAGRMTPDDAVQALKRSIWRLYGIER